MNHEPTWALILYRGYGSSVEWFCSREEAERRVPPNAVQWSHNDPEDVLAFTIIDVAACGVRRVRPDRSRERRRLVAPPTNTFSR